jgi:hypothetical protein
MLVNLFNLSFCFKFIYINSVASNRLRVVNHSLIYPFQAELYNLLKRKLNHWLTVSIFTRRGESEQFPNHAQQLLGARAPLSYYFFTQ